MSQRITCRQCLLGGFSSGDCHFGSSATQVDAQNGGNQQGFPLAYKASANTCQHVSLTGSCHAGIPSDVIKKRFSPLGDDGACSLVNQGGFMFCQKAVGNVCPDGIVVCIWQKSANFSMVGSSQNVFSQVPLHGRGQQWGYLFPE